VAGGDKRGMQSAAMIIVIYLPFEGDGWNGGGGGGGGKGEQAPPARGRMPDTARFQMVAPDPHDPTPLFPA